MNQDPRENFKSKDKSFGRWLWTCIKICILLIMIPLVIGALVFLASIALPVVLIAVPVMIAAWVWILLT